MRKKLSIEKLEKTIYNILIGRKYPHVVDFLIDYEEVGDCFAVNVFFDYQWAVESGQKLTTKRLEILWSIQNDLKEFIPWLKTRLYTHFKK